MDYYSSRLLYVSVVKDGRQRRRNLYDESVVIFRARDLDHAFERESIATRMRRGRQSGGRSSRS